MFIHIVTSWLKRVVSIFPLKPQYGMMSQHITPLPEEPLLLYKILSLLSMAFFDIGGLFLDKVEPSPLSLFLVHFIKKCDRTSCHLCS